jgi:hypothetical protein
MTFGKTATVLLGIFAAACAATAPEPGEAGPIASAERPAWVTGCRQSAANRDGRRLLVGVGCYSPAVRGEISSPELRTVVAANGARASAAAVVDLYLAALMAARAEAHPEENLFVAATIQKMRETMASGGALGNTAGEWRDPATGSVCFEREIDVQTDLLDRLDGTGLSSELVSFVRANGASVFDGIRPDLHERCQAPLPD